MSMYQAVKVIPHNKARQYNRASSAISVSASQSGPPDNAWRLNVSGCTEVSAAEPVWWALPA